MSSKESEGKGAYTKKLSDHGSNNDDGEKRPARRIFGRNNSRNSYSDSGSDMEMDDDGPKGSKQKKRSMRLGSFLYSPNHLKNNQGSNMIDDDPHDHRRGTQSHLFSLVRKKKAMNKYANNLVKNQDKTTAESEAVSTEKVRAEATDNATVKVEEGRMKSDDKVESMATIASYGGSKSSIDTADVGIIAPVVLTDEQKEEAEKVSKGILLLQESMKDYTHLISRFPIEIRIEKLSFSVPYTEASAKITTVYNSSFVYKTIKSLKRLTCGATESKHAKVSYTKHVLDNISLSLKPGKM